MIEVGFFRELRSLPKLPSLHSAISENRESDSTRLADYLDQGEVLVTSGQLVNDVIDPSVEDVGLSGLRTDGKFVWPGTLGHYVRRYGVTLPEMFWEHARDLNFSPPVLSDEEMVQAATVYQRIAFSSVDNEESL